MNEPVAISVSGQTVLMDDGCSLNVPYQLTVYNEAETGWQVKLDRTGRTYSIGVPLRSRLVRTMNLLLIDLWRWEGKVGRPAQVPEQSDIARPEA